MKTIPVRHITATRKEESTTGRFSIRKVQDILNGIDLQQDLHRHNFYFILLLQEGEGIHEIDFVPHPVTDKCVFLLRPGQVHQLQLKAGATGYLLEFDAEFYHPIDKLSAQRLRKASSKNFCQIEAGRFGKLNAILSLIFDEYLSKEDGYRDAIKASLEIFYIEFVRQSPNPKSASINGGPYVQERFDEFVNLLETHFTTHKQVSQYTGLMSLSSYQLNEITKTAVGKTASAVIDEHILLEAKRHLLATPNQVKEIADHIGYEDPSYFIRFFKKHTGLTPDTFRTNFT
jgi:AraC-like DNA-binding protein